MGNPRWEKRVGRERASETVTLLSSLGSVVVSRATMAATGEEKLYSVRPSFAEKFRPAVVKQVIGRRSPHSYKRRSFTSPPTPR